MDTGGRVDELTDAAVYLINTEGIGSLTIRKIAVVAHVSPSSVISHLENKQRVIDLVTKRIADHIGEQLIPRGVGVVVEAEHTCMSLRGARASGTRTVTAALFGKLRDDPASRAEFLSLTRGHR